MRDSCRGGAKVFANGAEVICDFGLSNDLVGDDGCDIGVGSVDSFVDVMVDVDDNIVNGTIVFFNW